jgi:AcrR family transcriptional regulator
MENATGASKPGRIPRRQMQAAQTRKDIVMAARRLFVERGYAHTTVNDIAEEAGVALQTVYSSIGTKSAIVLALADAIDEEVGLGDLVPQAMAETDPRRMIAWGVRIPYRFVERCGDYLSALISAATAEPDAARVLDEGFDRHHEGALAVATKLHAAGALAPGVTVESAHAALSLITWVPAQLLAQQTFGWDGPTWERWCVRLLTTALLGGGEPASL